MFVRSIVKISRKRAIIRNNGALFRKENIKKLGFFLKISYETIFIKISGGIIGIFLLFKKKINRDQYTLEFFWSFIYCIMMFFFSNFNRSIQPSLKIF